MIKLAPEVREVFLDNVRQLVNLQAMPIFDSAAVVKDLALTFSKLKGVDCDYAKLQRLHGYCCSAHTK